MRTKDAASQPANATETIRRAVSSTLHDACGDRTLEPFKWQTMAFRERQAIYLVDVQRHPTLTQLRSWLPPDVQQVLDATLASPGQWLPAAITLRMAHLTMLRTEEQVFDAFGWCVQHYARMPADQIQIDLHVAGGLQHRLQEHIQRTAKHAVVLPGLAGGEA